jgi:hypothetical protein
MENGSYYYVQLVESNRVPGSKNVKTTVVHNFGLLEELDFKGIERLIESFRTILPTPSSLVRQD